VAVDESLGGAVDCVAFLVAPVVELARKSAFEQAAVKVDVSSFAAAVEFEGVVGAVAGIVAVAGAVNTEGVGFAVVLARGAVEAGTLGSGIWMVFFAAVRGYVGWAVFVEPAVVAAVAVTRRAVDTSAAVAAAGAGAGAVAVGTAADTSYSAHPVTVGVAIHSMGERIALQLAVADDFHMLAPLHHIPGKPPACLHTAPSVAAEGTPVAVADAAVLVAEKLSNTVAAVAAAVEGSYIVDSCLANMTKADSSRVLAAAAASPAGPAPGHEKACNSWPLDPFNSI
jgi:hypothetical protein